MTDPILDGACSLPPPQREGRLLWIRDELSRARARQLTADGAIFEFDADPLVRERLAGLVALESACCDPQRIRFSLCVDPRDGTLRLELRGIDPDGPLLRGAGAPAASDPRA